MTSWPRGTRSWTSIGSTSPDPDVQVGRSSADLDILGRLLLSPSIQSPDEPLRADTDGDGRRLRREIRVGKNQFVEVGSHSWARTQERAWPLLPNEKRTYGQKLPPDDVDPHSLCESHPQSGWELSLPTLRLSSSTRSTTTNGFTPPDDLAA